MQNYKAFIERTYDFPTKEFTFAKENLHFHDVNIMDLIEEHGTPLKLSYLPVISEKINYAKRIFNQTLEEYGYAGKYTYCYCTKSSHFEFILDEILKNDVHIETSSAFDVPLVRNLFAKGRISKDTYILANGFKRSLYTQYLTELINDGFTNCIPILDNLDEIEAYKSQITTNCKVGIRIATDEEPNFSFYTSRLGVSYNDVQNLYDTKIKDDDRFTLKILHFFVNQGISDRPYYWNELSKFVTQYCKLKRICPSLDSIDIGGGFPIKTSLEFDYDYEYIVDMIVTTIMRICNEHQVAVPNIFTEFGSFTVGESGATIYQILNSKHQNDKEEWYMIDGSFITNLPDTWALNQKFILLAINNWDQPYDKVNLGGLTCDSMDYYNYNRHGAEIFLPQDEQDHPLYVGFFHTGAYQESVGGFGGIQHCLVPSPKHIIISKDSTGKVSNKVFRPEQSEKDVLKILGY